MPNNDDVESQSRRGPHSSPSSPTITQQPKLNILQQAKSFVQQTIFPYFTSNIGVGFGSGLLSGLKGIERVYIEGTSKKVDTKFHIFGETDYATDVFQYETFNINNESGQRIYIATFHYKMTQMSRHTIATLLEINLRNHNGETAIVKAIYSPPDEDSEHGACGCAYEECHDDCGWDICIQNQFTIQRSSDDHIYGILNNPCTSNSYTVTSLENNEVYYLRSNGMCCCLFCCGCCMSSFEIKLNSPDLHGKIFGKMQANWEENPGKFGINFSKSLSVESKVVLLIAGLYLNRMYFEETPCCGRVGTLGKQCSFVWTLVTGVTLLAMIVGGLVAFFLLDRTKNDPSKIK